MFTVKIVCEIEQKNLDLRTITRKNRWQVEINLYEIPYWVHATRGRIVEERKMETSLAKLNPDKNSITFNNK